jgi:glycosyltransferase involved in cell wall biosynthesis
MKLLIVTQVVDRVHSDLGFFHTWLETFAAACDRVTVVCLQAGEMSLPPSVTVHSLGKESGTIRLTRLWRFYTFIWRERSQYDAVLVHMNPEYVILGGIFWRIWRKPIALWYVHKHVGFRLRLALMLVHIVFTTSLESFRIPSPKVQVMGHGIPDEAFIGHPPHAGVRKKILMVGRMSRSKGIDVGVRVLEQLGGSYDLVVVGGEHTIDDMQYRQEIASLITEKQLTNNIQFIGAVAPEVVRKYYAEGDIFLHTSTTGSMDKVVLEALAAGLPVVSTGEAFKEIPGVVYVEPGDIATLANTVKATCSREISTVGVHYVRTTHSLRALVTRILRILQDRML